MLMVDPGRKTFPEWWAKVMPRCGSTCLDCSKQTSHLRTQRNAIPAPLDAWLNHAVCGDQKGAAEGVRFSPLIATWGRRPSPRARPGREVRLRSGSPEELVPQEDRAAESRPRRSARRPASNTTLVARQLCASGRQVPVSGATSRRRPTRNLRPGLRALRFQPVDKLAHDEGSVVTAEAEAVAQSDADG
jgi:hypothetical protein